ncbi:MAG: hypothetical protein HY319_14660 [Armatimonadetes bacterium]|nr:hypothetical protein [Armatimonadota bacterium]
MIQAIRHHQGQVLFRSRAAAPQEEVPQDLYHSVALEPTAQPLRSCGSPAAVETPVPALAEPPNEKERYWQAIAREALERLNGGRPLAAQDQDWLDRLQAALGRPFAVIPDPDHPSQGKVLDTRLTVEKLNASPEKREALERTLAAMLEATRDAPMVLGDIKIHNPQVAERMASGYTASSFRELFGFCERNGVFDISVDPASGLIRTSGGTENAEMAARQWVTDSVRCGELERDRDPEGWKKALSTVALFYSGPREAEAFEKAIRDPESYRRGGPAEGVAHIFIPATLERDPDWANNKRLESHGMALRAMCDCMIAGAVRGERWGFSCADEVSDSMISTVARMARMFAAIGYESAPAVGNWEETVFPGGLTWDTEAMRSGLESLHDLMHNSAYDGNAQIARLRERLRQAPHGDFLADATALQDSIRAGQDRVRRTYMAESPGIREMDSSLTFLSQSTIRLDDDPAADARKHLDLLEAVEKNLVRGNGMIRYLPFQVRLQDGTAVSSPDSYLSQNYTIAADRDGKIDLEWAEVMNQFGSKDASDPEVFAARAQLSSPDKEAEWFMVSDLAHGYAEQINKLLDQPADPARKELMARARAGAERSINRAYARITDAGRVKANGRKCPALAVPEAYAHVTSLREGSDGNRSTRPIPGENTPLMWAASSLYAASKELQRALDRLEAQP